MRLGARMGSATCKGLYARTLGRLLRMLLLERSTMAIRHVAREMR
jgi:hypothetical protein